MARKEHSKSPLEKARLQYEVEVLPLLKSIQNTYWKDALSNVNDTLNSTVTLSPYQYRILIH